MGIEGVLVPIYDKKKDEKKGEPVRDRRFSTSGSSNGKELSPSQVSRGSRETLLGN